MGTKTRLLASGKTEDNEFNISLLGFKMAVNEGLTVFNLVDGVDLKTGKEALRLAAQKLPIKTKFVIRRDLQN